MTAPINERLEKIRGMVRWGDYQREDGSWGRGVVNWAEINAAILSLFREVVEEAKPAEQETSLQLWKESLNETHAMMLVDYGTGYNKAINKYHANLLQQLGEKQ